MSELTVKAALELPELRSGLPKIVAGEESLGRQIRWVHSGEAPNIASLLHGGELLLTTGMGMGGQAHQQKFITELATQGIAGLIVELGGVFNGHLPPKLITAASEHDVPLIELHATVRFVTITEAIHTEIVNRDYELLRRAERLQRQFTGAMLRGDGVPGVLSLLAKALGNPVFLETDEGHLAAHATPPTGEGADPVAAWADSHDATAIAVEATIPTGGLTPSWRLLALPLVAPLDAFSHIAVERAAEIVALALLRDRQESELLAVGRGDFLAKLADGRIDPDLAASRATEMGFLQRGTGALLPLAARLMVPQGNGFGGGERTSLMHGSSTWASTLRELEREVAGIGVPSMVGVHPRSGELLLVVGLPNGADRAAVAERVARGMQDTARRRAAAALVIAAGPAADWHEIGAGLRDAIEGAAVAPDLPDAPWHDATRIPLERLLWGLRDSEYMWRYVDRVLGPIVQHDARRKQKLLPTLEALCSSGGRKAMAARQLRLNRQALYKRIERLEGVLDCDLGESETLLSLDLALRARRHLHPAR